MNALCFADISLPILQAFFKFIFILRIICSLKLFDNSTPPYSSTRFIAGHSPIAYFNAFFNNWQHRHCRHPFPRPHFIQTCIRSSSLASSLLTAAQHHAPQATRPSYSRHLSDHATARLPSTPLAIESLRSYHQSYS